MDNSVRSRSNHYDTLQVAPSASSDEIVQAFSLQMRTARVRPDISVARLAQLSVAYETLRDPAKRRAYDASLGLTLKPRIAVSVAGTTLLERLNRVADAAPSAEPPASPNVASQFQTESRVAAFIAASVREPAKRAEPPQAVPPEPIVAPAPEPPQQFRPTVEVENPWIDRRRVPLTRTGATVGAGVAGLAVLIIALASPQANPDRIAVPAAQPQTAVTVPLPAVGSTNDSKLPETAAPPVQILQTENRPDALRKVDVPVRSVAGADQPIADQPSAKPIEVAAVDAPQVASDTEQSPTEDEPATVSAQVGLTSTKLPLPEATIARTIQRIGYGCGRVVSATGVEGEDGVFKVTCSSGDAYRAAPVGGRYHFRRWASH